MPWDDGRSISQCWDLGPDQGVRCLEPDVRSSPGTYGDDLGKSGHPCQRLWSPVVSIGMVKAVVLAAGNALAAGTSRSGATSTPSPSSDL